MIPSSYGSYQKFAFLLLGFLQLSQYVTARYNWSSRDYLYYDVLNRCGGECKNIMPLPANNESLTVYIGFRLVQINYIDITQQSLFSTFWLTLMWYDRRLSWNPKAYDQISKITLNPTSVWTPDVTLLNDIALQDPRDKTHNIVITDAGLIKWVIRKTRRTACSLEMKRFPYDNQTCLIAIGSRHQGSHKMRFEILKVDENNLTNIYVPNSEWTLVAIVSEVFSDFSDNHDIESAANFYVHIQRKPRFYEFNILLVIIVIELLTMSSFFLPIESGERMLLGISTLLTTALYLDMMNKYTPVQSDSIPFIVAYCIGVLIVATGSTICALCVSILYERKRTLPTKLKTMVFNHLSRFLHLDQEFLRLKNCQYLKIRHDIPIDQLDDHIAQTIVNSELELLQAPRAATMANMQKDIIRLIHSVYNRLQFLQQINDANDMDDLIVRENRFMATIINRLSGVLFLSLILIFTLVCFLCLEKPDYSFLKTAPLNL